MSNYITVDKQVAEAARNAFLRHRWYLTEELIPLALCSKQISKTEHERFAFCFHKTFQRRVAAVKDSRAPLAPEKPRFPELSPDTCVSDLVGDRSVIILQRLNFSLHDLLFLPILGIDGVPLMDGRS